MKRFLFIMLLAACAVSTQAQTVKIAYINSQKLLEKMPEAVAANQKLMAMAGEYDSIYREYIFEYQKLIKEIQSGTLSEVMREVKLDDAQKLEDRLQSFEQDTQDKLDAKKAELYQPIIDKATKLVQDVAKANGYTYVLDNSLGVLIMAPDGDDILDLVLKALTTTPAGK
ncbi:MAG: OmpH family outer membrane protein [Chitinophagales bacterium]